MSEIPVGLCQCGCGGKTRVAKQSVTKYGYVRGTPVPFLPGHNTRLRGETPARDRFERLVYSDPNSGCHIFAGASDRFGYGRFSFGGKMDEAHRVAWFLAGRTIAPETPFVLHKCDIPCCVNPDHLFLGTAHDNSHDMLAKNRQRKGPLPYGVHERKNRPTRFVAMIYTKREDGSTHHEYLGSFASPEAAAVVAQEARERRGY